MIRWSGLRALILSLLAAAALAQPLPPTDLDRVRPGLAAPDFLLPTGDGRAFHLSDFRGKNVVLVFYRGHW
jgi:cytochrome oxidase Cu insertion factor (SCO1/SenC/PrrC family)